MRTLALAQDAVSAADAETDKLALELAELEAALAHAPPEAMDTAPPVCSLDMLGSQLKQFISALKADEHIDPAHLSHAEAHVSQLIGGFEAHCSMQGAPGRQPACPTGASSASMTLLPATSPCPPTSPTPASASSASSRPGASSPTSSRREPRRTPPWSLRRRPPRRW